MNHYINNYNSYVENMYDKRRELISKLSKADKEQDDILHFLEFEKYNAATMMKVTKKLKEVRANRREIKNELSEIQTICDSIKPCKQMEEKKTYTYKSEILKEYIK